MGLKLMIPAKVVKSFLGAIVMGVIASSCAYAQTPAATTSPAAGSAGQSASTVSQTTSLLTSLSSNCTQKDTWKTCLIYGPLLVPGKFELTGNRDVFGSATIGPVFGFQLGSDVIKASAPWDQFVAGWGMVGFVAFSQNIGGQTNTTSSTSGQYPGVSYGGGITKQLFYSDTVKGMVHLVALVGFDHVANSDHYQYNDKPWISLTFGLGF